MKEKLFLPLIKRDDFEAFKGIIKRDLAPSFEEWRNRHQDRISHYFNERDVVEVNVDPENFKAFADERGKSYDTNTLLSFAEFLATGKG